MSPIKLGKKPWLFFILPTAGIIALFIFLSRPLFKEMKSLNSQIEGAKVKLTDLQRTAATKDKLIQEISAMHEAIEYYKRRIPGEKGTPWLLMELSRVARETGVRYLSISPQPPQKIESYIVIPIDLQIKSGYHNFGKFLSKVESSQRFMAVEYFTLTPDASNPLKHGINLRISTFMLPQ